MKQKFLTTLALFLSILVLYGCGGGGSAPIGPPRGSNQVVAPTVTTKAAQNGAQIVTLATTTSGAAIHFTLDGSTPSATSPKYEAPLLVASNVTVKAIGVASGSLNSDVTSQSFTPNAASGTLVWSDEFANTTGANAQPDASIWGYDTGAGGFGNAELENYCAYGSTTSPCDASNPNAYVGTDGLLHIVARQPSTGVYTSARMKTQGKFSFTTGRIEAKIKLPEGQGLWPAFWMLGNSIATANWPACGEQDIMEHINAPTPDWYAASIHATGINGTQNYPTGIGTSYLASDWHVYGMKWTAGTIQYYIDDPANVIATYNSSSYGGSQVWPFETNGGGFIILNLAVGGNWPGAPNSSTPFPSEMQVDYVRIYAN